MTRPAEAAPVVGGSYLLGEDDYRFGAGPLAIRVTRVIGPVHLGQDGRVEPWWQVEADCRAPGLAGCAQRRFMYVRAACLPTARRHGGG